MPKAYWIAAHMDIKDMYKLMASAEQAGPVIEAPGGVERDICIVEGLE